MTHDGQTYDDAIKELDERVRRLERLANPMPELLTADRVFVVELDYDDDANSLCVYRDCMRCVVKDDALRQQLREFAPITIKDGATLEYDPSREALVVTGGILGLGEHIDPANDDLEQKLATWRAAVAPAQVQVDAHDAVRDMLSQVDRIKDDVDALREWERK